MRCWRRGPPPARSGWTRLRDEASEQRPHLAALADPRGRAATSVSRTSGSCRDGRAGRLPRLVTGSPRSDPSQSSSSAIRPLFAIRWKLGELLGWDRPDAGLGSRVPTLRDRLPPDLRDAPPGPDFEALPFTSLYLTEDEFAAEVANRTMHGVMHIGRVADTTGGFRAPDGRPGEAERSARRGLHGRHQAIPAADRVPGDAAQDRAGA